MNSKIVLFDVRLYRTNTEYVPSYPIYYDMYYSIISADCTVDRGTRSVENGERRVDSITADSGQEVEVV